MDNNERKTQNAPSSDSTSALFVSSRKKQLEEQEAQRIAAEKEAQRLAAEEEVRRLEREVEQRKIQAEEDAKRIEAESIERRKQAQIDAKKAEAEARKAAAAKSPSAVTSTVSATASATATAVKEKSSSLVSDVMADKKKMMIAGGGILGVILAIVLIIVLAGGGGSKLSLDFVQGDWFLIDGSHYLVVKDEAFVLGVVETGDMYEGTIEIDKNGMHLAFDGRILYSFDLGRYDYLYQDGYYKPYVREDDFATANEQQAELLALYVAGNWSYDGNIIWKFSEPKEGEVGGTVEFLNIETDQKTSSTYEITDYLEIVVELDGDYFYFNLTTNNTLYEDNAGLEWYPVDENYEPIAIG